uniref:Uncharacterized protein n=1 Tax=Candidatus Kentrum sp. LPFa TaxID=2126335 RepID=A0A450XJZ6_9GAMM|nr:MAG: hypothetical protein BECKLPF1236A_GA0070988_1009423 [Candidatus Kentron sp. LPFa]VFK29607.1 MAG: hypothetical protein BECKLPF1236C_GA0070990_1009023 [Candidatus Kentron sp. LPFa]
MFYIINASESGGYRRFCRDLCEITIFSLRTTYNSVCYSRNPQAFPIMSNVYYLWNQQIIIRLPCPFRYRKNKNPQKIGACARNTPFGAYCYALTCSTKYPFFFTNANRRRFISEHGSEHGSLCFLRLLWQDACQKKNDPNNGNPQGKNHDR